MAFDAIASRHDPSTSFFWSSEASNEATAAVLQTPGREEPPATSAAWTAKLRRCNNGAWSHWSSAEGGAMAGGPPGAQPQRALRHLDGLDRQSLWWG
uniref:Uncharacterized protein n=2 Tax=Oryza TaxID=4527 RepID=A0A0D3G7A6_9ORYZ